jgi:hypothetical protein
VEFAPVQIGTGPNNSDHVTEVCHSRQAVIMTILLSSKQRPSEMAAEKSTTTTTTTPTPAPSVSRISDNILCNSLNIRSLNNDKLDALMGICRNEAIDVSVLVETWHDVDSICFNRVRMNGFQVVDRPRPSANDDLSMSTNHGGVAIVASPGTLLPPYVIAVSPTTFEFTTVQLVHGLFSAVVIYRPGSQAFQAAFFDFVGSHERCGNTTRTCLLGG